MTIRKLMFAVAAVSGAVSAPALAADPLAEMFRWWNGAIKVPGGFAEQAFARHFTADAALVLDGREVAKGLPALTRHFQAIQSSGAQVEIVLPFKESFRRGDKLYTYHVIRSRRAGVPGCMLAAGHALLRGRRISLISLVRTKVEQGSPAFDPTCWRA